MIARGEAGKRLVMASLDAEFLREKVGKRLSLAVAKACNTHGVTVSPYHGLLGIRSAMYWYRSCCL